METLTWEQVRAWRLGRHHLIERAPRRRILEVVSALCGVHAQVASAAELQLWARVDGIKPSDVREALWERRTLVRTWAMRGTLHLLTAEDLPLYVAALRTHDRWWKGAWLKYIGMSGPELRSLLEAIRASLGSRPLTRSELADKVASRVGPAAEKHMLSNWGEMLKPAAFHGWLMSGPPRGQNVTFVRPDRWMGKWRQRRPDEAWRQIVRRYLAAYGPAGREEFGRWWGLQAAPAGRILEQAADDLTEVDLEGRKAWVWSDDLSEMQRSAIDESVRLLPAFDVYVAGSRPKESLVEKRLQPKVFRQAGWISPVMLVNGVIAGVWSHERKGRRLAVTVQPFGRLSTGEETVINEEADRLGEFLDMPAVVSYARP
ncbi:MAG TPA: winged helix DNA-binding domain-containing protein [Actinomycetota bacterium]